MDKNILFNKLLSRDELYPNRYDGSYELMTETVKAYRDCSYDILNYKDLNLVYLMSVGTWKHGFTEKIKCIENSSLSIHKKEHLKNILDNIKRAAEQGKYEHAERLGSVGMFGTGFYSFINKTDDNSVKRFVKLCVDILPLQDDDKIFDLAEQAFSVKIKGMQAAAASMVLHCLKPYTFPILNGVMKKENAFSVLGIDLKKTGEISEYIPNCRKIKAYRDANFKFKNYRVFDLEAWSKDYEYTDKILEIIQSYKNDFETRDKEERYKWQAVGTYKSNWDINAPNFCEMLKSAFKDSDNLLKSGNYFPYKMLCIFAEEQPETVRTLFRNLYNENLSFEERYNVFREGFINYYKPKNLSHYQDLHAISVYLTCEYPEKYYIYKYTVVKEFIKRIGYECVNIDAMSDSEKMSLLLELYNVVLDVVQQDEELISISQNRLDDSCYDDNALHMLTHDVIYFGSKYKSEAGFWPSQEEYPLSLTKDDWKKYILEIELPNHPSPMKMLKGMLEFGGEASCKLLSKKFGGSPSVYIGCATNLGRRVKKYFNLPPCMDNDQERYFPFPFLGKGVDDADGHQYIYKIRPELFAALNEIDLSNISPYYEEGEKMNSNTIAKNTILYGPPGTGKTYNSACYAVAIIENKNITEVLDEAVKDYESVFKRYTDYKNDGLVEFVTFHQSYGYEEFIEGIKPVIQSEDEEKTDISYSVESGIFKKFCEKASRQVLKKQNQDIGLNKTPTIWKVSLEGTGDNMTRSECMQNGHIRIGYDSYGPDITDDTNFNEGGKNVVNALIYKMKKGDIIFSCYSASTIDAIGVVTGDYEWHDEYPHYKRLRKVNWIVKGIREDIVDINNGTQMTLSSVYKLNISLDDAMALIQKHVVTTVEEKKNHVFIIDEINRGNISKIFGELITLIEDSKRIGAKEELKVALPYSPKSKPFGIPDNIYILGTMNTADRSIAALDTALRRRFSFIEMMPEPEVLKGVIVDGIDINKMLEKINKRIEVLFDREHTIGHAYFVKLKEAPTIDVLSDIFENKIIPLLQEYFYEDYEKIRLVLGDNQVAEENKQFVSKKAVDVAALFGNDETDIIDESVFYSINTEALENSEAYIKIYK